MHRHSASLAADLTYDASGHLSVNALQRWHGKAMPEGGGIHVSNAAVDGPISGSFMLP
jgi:hypothetical protein